MPRFDEYDDYDDQPPRSSVPFPTGVRAAGIIWLGLGGLGLLTSSLSMVLNAAGGQGNIGSGGCSIVFAIAFLVIGIQTVKGTAKGTTANGIGSIVFGVMYGALAVLAVAVVGPAPVAKELLYVLGAVAGLLSAALLGAGFLAISGRTAYSEWRVANSLERHRRLTPEEEDYDDRPRRPE